MRDSGLAHLLAISGLHMGLVAGWLFVGLRAVLEICNLRLAKAVHREQQAKLVNDALSPLCEDETRVVEKL